MPEKEINEIQNSVDQLDSELSNESLNKKEEIKQTLTVNDILDTIQFFSINGWERERLLEAIKRINPIGLKDSTIINICYSDKWREPTEFEWIDLALEKIIKSPESKIIVTSVIPLDYLLKNMGIENNKKDKLNLLLSKSNAKFLDLIAFSPEDLKTIFPVESEIENEEEINSETSFQNIMESEISRFLHDAKYRIELGHWSHVVYEDQLSYLFNLPEEKKIEKRIEFENKLISMLQMQHPSFKSLPRDKNLQRIVDMYKYSRADVLPEWTRFEWVFIDRDWCLYDNKNLKFNPDIIDMIKDYEGQWKKITIWTGWNIEMKQKLLDEAGLNYKIQNKTDYKWWTVEIAIDNDPQEFLLANAKIKSEKHIKV